MDPTVPATEPVTKRAADLAVGDHVMGDLLPLGQPGEVIFRRTFLRDRSEWVFVAFVQWDGFHDSTTFLASAPVRVRNSEPARVADPTGLGFSRTDGELAPGVALTVITPADPAVADVVLTRPGRRVEPHTGGVTDEGLVDETPGEGPTQQFQSRWQDSLPIEPA